MDGPTDLNPPSAQAAARARGVGILTSKPTQCTMPREIPLIQKCRQLIINAAAAAAELPIYWNNTRGSSCASCSSLEQKKYKY